MELDDDFVVGGPLVTREVVVEAKKNIVDSFEQELFEFSSRLAEIQSQVTPQYVVRQSSWEELQHKDCTIAYGV